MPQQWKRLARHPQPAGRVGGPQWGAKVERPSGGAGGSQEPHLAATGKQMWLLQHLHKAQTACCHNRGEWEQACGSFPHDLKTARL